MNIVIAVTIEWDREEWEEAIFGSGCLSYPWWVSVERHGDTVLAGEPIWKVTWTDPDSTAPYLITESRYLTAHDMAVNAGRLAAESPTLARALTDHDLDADMADLILQQTVFGEVIYG